jgi:hypothetical protein
MGFELRASQLLGRSANPLIHAISLILLRRPYYESNLQRQYDTHENFSDFFFHRNRRNNPIFSPNHKKSLNSQTILRKHTKLGLSHYFTSKSITRLLCGTGIKSHLQSLEQNREPRLSPCAYGQLVLCEIAKVIQWGYTVL